MNQIEVIPGVVITNQRCAVIKERRMVVLSDLHVGYESVLEDSGLHLPRIQTQSMCESLQRIIELYRPDRFLVLGDVKHEFSRNLSQEWSEARRLLGVMSDQGEVIVVRGNHDNYLANIASKLGVQLADEHFEGGVHFAHGHLPSASRPLVMGHEHPSVRLSDEVGAFVKLPCFLLCPREQVLVMPAFSPLAAGTDFTSPHGAEPLSPILARADMSQAKAYACSEIGLLELGPLGRLGRSRASRPGAR